MEDSTISTSQVPLGVALSSSSVAKNPQVKTLETKPKSAGLPPEQESAHGLSPDSAQYAKLLEQLKNHPGTPQELSPKSESLRIEAIKKAEARLLQENWPSPEDLNQLARVLQDQFH